jgi:hypothetical protein
MQAILHSIKAKTVKEIGLYCNSSSPIPKGPISKRDLIEHLPHISTLLALIESHQSQLGLDLAYDVAQALFSSIFSVLKPASFMETLGKIFFQARSRDTLIRTQIEGRLETLLANLYGVKTAGEMMNKFKEERKQGPAPNKWVKVSKAEIHLVLNENMQMFTGRENDETLDMAIPDTDKRRTNIVWPNTELAERQAKHRKILKAIERDKKLAKSMLNECLIAR